MPKIANNRLDFNFFFFWESFSFIPAIFMAEMRVVETLQDILSLSWAAE